MTKFQVFISAGCFACYLKEKGNKPKATVKPKNMNFQCWDFRKEIVPDKLRLPHIENCLFNPNLCVYTKSMLQKFYVVVLTVQRSKVKCQCVHVITYTHTHIWH